MKIITKNWIFFIEEELINFIFKEAIHKTEKIGYIFGKQIKATNEIIVDSWTCPHPKDVSTEKFSKISRKHKKIGKKILKMNKFLFNIGFFHTHPNWFKTKPSNIDIREFQKFNKQNSLFIIATINEMSFYIYSKNILVLHQKIRNSKVI